MRSIKIGFPSGTPQLVLWESTEDEQAFPIKAVKTHPYVKAFGVRYDLTTEEVKIMQEMLSLGKEIFT